MLLLNLKNEIVVKINTCVYSQSITFVTNKGSIFYTKAGEAFITSSLRVNPNQAWKGFSLKLMGLRGPPQCAVQDQDAKCYIF